MSDRIVDKLKDTATQHGYEMHDLLIDAAHKIEDLNVDNANLRQDLKDLNAHVAWIRKQTQ